MSAITITSLAATAGVGQVILTWVQGGEPCLPYLKLVTVEVWEATTNDRAAASKVGDVKGNAYTRSDLTPGTPRYYWVRAVDASGQFGPWHPTSETAGVTATPAKVTTEMVEPGAVDYQAFASSIEPVGLVNGLPSLSGYVGPRVVYNQADGKIYRVSGGAWTTKLNTGDLQGYISAAQISVTSLAAISADLGSITAGSLSAVAITSATITGGTITGSTFQTGTSGKRIVIDTTNDDLVAYDPYGTATVQINKSGYGTIEAKSGSISLPAIKGESTSGYYGIWGKSSTGIAVFAETGGTLGLHAKTTATSTGHGLRGQSAGTGLVGVSSVGGSFAFYAEIGGYGPFTGQHDGLIDKLATAPQPGDILVDGPVIGKSLSDVITEVCLSSVPNDASALGVFVAATPLAAVPAALSAGMDDDGDPIPVPGFDSLAATFNRVSINAVGEGCINVCGEAGDIAKGDLIVTSSMPGKGMRQADDIIRSYTVAKAREAATFSDPSEIKQIACIYLCG